jgi:hypothetical protein
MVGGIYPRDAMLVPLSLALQELLVDARNDNSAVVVLGGCDRVVGMGRWW